MTETYRSQSVCHCQRKPGIAPHWYELLEGCPKDGPAAAKPVLQPAFRCEDECEHADPACCDDAEEIESEEQLEQEFAAAAEQLYPEFDPVNHPRHYTVHPSGVECIDVIETMPYCIGAAIKYLWRCDLKHPNGVQDLEKARWYIDREISRRRQAGWEGA